MPVFVMMLSWGGMIVLVVALGVVLLLWATAWQHRRHAAATEPRLCRFCGTGQPAFARFCRRCGRRL